MNSTFGYEMASSLTVLYFTFRMWPTESEKFARDDPVQISVLDPLEGRKKTELKRDGKLIKIKGTRKKTQI